MNNENNNKKLIAEFEIRIGLRVYKIDISAKYRWVWVLGLLLAKYVYNFLEGDG